MFGRILSLAAVLAVSATGVAAAADMPVKAMAPAAPAPFFFVNDNSLSYSYQFTATDPGVAGTMGKNVVTFTHFDVWAYGTNFLTFDYLMSNQPDNVFGGTTGMTEFYGLFRSTFGFNQIFNTHAFSMGPLTNVSLEVGADGETEDGGILAHKRDVVAGLDFSFALPYGGHFELSPLAYKEWNHNVFYGPGFAAFNATGDTDFNWTWAVETVYAMPLGFLPGIPLTFSGRAAFYGPKGPGITGAPGTKTEFNSEQRLTLDVGKLVGSRPGMLSYWVGYRYWKNKFGVDPVASGVVSTVESSWVTGVTVAF
jgi:hypothetical protein